MVQKHFVTRARTRQVSINASQDASSVSADTGDLGHERDMGRQAQSERYSETFEDDVTTRDRSTLLLRSAESHTYMDSSIAESAVASPSKVSVSASANTSVYVHVHAAEGSPDAKHGPAGSLGEACASAGQSVGEDGDGASTAGRGSVSSGAGKGTAGYEDDFEEMSEAHASSIATDMSHEVSMQEDEVYPRITVQTGTSWTLGAASLLQVNRLRSASIQRA